MKKTAKPGERGKFLDTGAGNEYNTMDTMEAQRLLW